MTQTTNPTIDSLLLPGSVAGGYVRDGDNTIMTRSAEIAAGSIVEDSREIDVLASSGQSVIRYDWDRGEFFNEILEMSEKAVDLSRVVAGVCPVLFNHSRASQLGVTRAAQISGKGLSAKLQYASGVNDLIEEKWKLIQQGMLNGYSIGYRVNEYRRSSARAENGLYDYTAVRWVLLEISNAVIPAEVNLAAA